jgi:hypothetical protein
MSDDGGLTDPGGVIDVHGYSLDELATAIDEPALGQALDHILTMSDNSAGFHGFNNSI